MLLTTALLKSNYGIARRRRMRYGKHPEYQFAVATRKGTPFIFSGLSGIISRIAAVDQMRTDWEPITLKPDKSIGIQEVK